MSNENASTPKRSELSKLIIALVVTVGAVVVAVIGWLVMWRANVWLAPAPDSVDVAALVDPDGYHRGRRHYNGSCFACHGDGGEGMPEGGKPLVTSAFVADLNDDELSRFIKLGRTTMDPANTTGIEMPGKGGNPTLNDEHIRDIVVYLRALQDLHANG